MHVYGMLRNGKRLYLSSESNLQINSFQGGFKLFLQTGADAVSEVCREMGVDNEDDIAEYAIFTYLEDRKSMFFSYVFRSLH